MRIPEGDRGRWSRRDFLQASAASLAAAAGIGCLDDVQGPDFSGEPHLTAQVSAPSTSLAAGSHPLGLHASRDGRLFIPSGYQHDTPATLMLSLHGAGGSGTGIATAFQALAEAAGIVVLAPDSRFATWDLIVQDFGPDVTFIDAALESTFERVNVDPARLTIAGFSDGATYSLGLGLANGTLFKRVIAFSPGYLRTKSPRGKPPVFITHGDSDPVLPIDTASRMIVPVLETGGYTVEYHEFAGGHVVNQALAEDALAWAAATP
jgi:predicted esterase